jgi:hypothetical protein
LENGIGIAKEDWNGLKLILEGKKVVKELDEDRVMVRAVSEDVGQDRGIEGMGEWVEEMKEGSFEVIQKNVRDDDSEALQFWTKSLGIFGDEELK